MKTLESINDKKFQKLNIAEMKNINGGKWRVTDITYSKSPDGMQSFTHTYLERTNIWGRVIENTVNHSLDAQACS